MIFSGFETTHNKHVDGNITGAALVHQKRKYRQYMNRKGGFNRPLDPLKWSFYWFFYYEFFDIRFSPISLALFELSFHRHGIFIFFVKWMISKFSFFFDLLVVVNSINIINSQINIQLIYRFLDEIDIENSPHTNANTEMWHQIGYGGCKPQ